MSLEELRSLAVKLKERIACDPLHSRMERVELEDVNKWLAEREKESQPSPKRTL
jgi:hypothetical protein